MTQNEIVMFFVQIATMLCVALVCGQLMRLVRLPAVLGELIGGVLLGPTLLGTFAPNAYAYIFPATANIIIGRETLLTISIVLFLLVVGMELNPGQLKTRGLNIIWTSALGVAIPFAMGYSLVILVPGLWVTQAKDSIFPFALFIGTAKAMPINPPPWEV